MDRDNNYDRILFAYNALTKGEGVKAASAHDAIMQSYDKDETDEFVKPTVVLKADGTPTATIKNGDSIIFFNFRPDRAREITHCFCDDTFDKFERGDRIKTTYVCFADYDPLIKNKEVAFKKVEVTNTFGEWLAAHGMKTVPDRRDREVCPCHLLLQRRRGKAESGRGPRSGQQSQGCCDL
jgi:2,3-bisphosphoglycerate-independent phosphoglycerate mutase